MSRSNKLSTKTIMDVFNKGRGRCWYCGTLLTWEGRNITRDTSPLPNTFAIDHLIPQIAGGTNKLDNLVPACWSCNLRKRSYDIEDFRSLETRLENHMPRFSDEQLFYLASIGVSLPFYEPHVFWFEAEGLE